MKFTSESFGNKKGILKFPDHYVGIAVTVDDTGIVENEDGKKIVPAGTIVGGTTGSVIEDDTLLVAEKNELGAEGILFSDVDVTHGPANATMILHGFVDLAKLPSPPVADAKNSLKQIFFIK